MPQDAGLLAGALPESVVVVEVFSDAKETELFPQEAELVGHSAEERRREFATVRACARIAMAELGIGPSPIMPGAMRAPQWPEGIVGSLTHCAGYRAAAVARSEDVAAVGLDAEPNMPLPSGVEALVTLPDERRTLAQLRSSVPDVAWDRLLFSAKESVFKAWFPLTNRWLDFNECVITIDAGLGTFTGHLMVPGPLVSGEPIECLLGRWRTLGEIGTGHIATAVSVAAGEEPQDASGA